MSKNNAGKYAVGAVVMGLVGYAIGILTAPKSGKETRQDIKEGASRIASDLEKRLKKVHSELGTVIENAKVVLSEKSGRAKEELEKALAVAKDKQQKIKVLITALRESGATDDPELEKALKEANSALSHLKKYMS